MHTESDTHTHRVQVARVAREEKVRRRRRKRRRRGAVPWHTPLQRRSGHTVGQPVGGDVVPQKRQHLFQVRHGAARAALGGKEAREAGACP